MDRFKTWMDTLFRAIGWQGIIPTGLMAPDNIEPFDFERQPEQYAEFIDSPTRQFLTKNPW